MAGSYLGPAEVGLHTAMPWKMTLSVSAGCKIKGPVNVGY